MSDGKAQAMVTVRRHPTWRTIKPWTRHAMTLTVSGAVYFAIGLTMVFQGTSIERAKSLELALDIMQYSWWGIGFSVVGIFTVVSSRWPAVPRSLGYSVLTGWSVLWSGFNLYGGLSTGSPAFVANGFVWGIVAFLWWVISGFVTLPKARMDNEPVAASGCPTGSVDRCNLSLLDAETILASPDASGAGESPSLDGDGSV